MGNNERLLRTIGKGTIQRAQAANHSNNVSTMHMHSINILNEILTWQRRLKDNFSYGYNSKIFHVKVKYLLYQSE